MMEKLSWVLKIVGVNLVTVYKNLPITPRSYVSGH